MNGILSLVLLIFVVLALALAVIFFLPQETKKKKIYFTGELGGRVEVSVDVADNDLTRMRGLMFRSSLPEKEGMLFIFPKSARYAFWMANVSIGLDAVFIDENYSIVDILAMKPCKTLEDYCTRYTPKGAALYVVELNEGFSERHGIKEGSKVDLG